MRKEALLLATIIPLAILGLALGAGPSGAG